MTGARARTHTHTHTHTHGCLEADGVGDLDLDRVVAPNLRRTCTHTHGKRAKQADLDRVVAPNLRRTRTHTAGERAKQADLDRVVEPNLRRAVAKEVDRLHVRNFAAITLTPVKGSRVAHFIDHFL